MFDDEAEEASETATGDSLPPDSLSGDLTSSSTAIAFTSSSSSGSGSGNGRCSAKKVSLPAAETPAARQVCSSSVRLLVSSHWSTYCHTRFLGVVPVEVSAFAPCSAKALTALVADESSPLDILWYVSVALERLVLCTIFSMTAINKK